MGDEGTVSALVEKHEHFRDEWATRAPTAEYIRRTAETIISRCEQGASSGSGSASGPGSRTVDGALVQHDAAHVQEVWVECNQLWGEVERLEGLRRVCLQLSIQKAITFRDLCNQLMDSFSRFEQTLSQLGSTISEKTVCLYADFLQESKLKLIPISHSHFSTASINKR